MLEGPITLAFEYLIIGHLSPAKKGRVVIFPFHRGGIVAFRVKSARDIMSRPTLGSPSASPSHRRHLSLCTIPGGCSQNAEGRDEQWHTHSQ